MTIQTSRSTPFSYYSLTIWLVSGSSKLSRDTQLIVKPARDEYSISASPSTLLIAQGSSGESVITARVLPLTDVVNEGLPMLYWIVSAPVETGSLPSGGWSSLMPPAFNATLKATFTVPQDAAPGNYTINLYATWYSVSAENETRQLMIPLTVVMATTTRTVSPPASTVPFIGVPEILLAVLLGLFVVARMRRRMGA